jgi:hypothetical protein
VDYSDESYVRLYTRDTKTWLRLGFEGQTVLMFLLRKVDRAGVLDGMDEPESDLSLVTGVPLAFVQEGLPRLLKGKVVHLVGNRLIIPNFIEAQAAPRTDKARQRDTRDKRAALGRLVTARHKTEPPGHSPSQSVTPSLATPSSTKLSSAEEEISSSPPPASVDPPTPLLAIREVFAEWQTVHAHPDAKLDAKRTARIGSALKLFAPDQLKQAIRGALKDDWLMMRDPKSPRKYDGLETILRDSAQIERLIELETGKTKPPRRITSGSLQPDAGRTGDEFFRGIRV